MIRVRSIERLAGDVSLSALIFIRVKIAQPDINTKGRQPAAQRAVAPARIEDDSRQFEPQPRQPEREARHKVGWRRIKIMVSPFECAEPIAMLRRLSEGHSHNLVSSLMLNEKGRPGSTEPSLRSR